MSNEGWKRNLAVPFFTQRDNTYVWQQREIKKVINQKAQEIEEIETTIGPKYPMAWRSCNITSLCMILHYWGLTTETPNQMIEKVFSKTEDGWKWLYEETNENSYPRTGPLD